MTDEWKYFLNHNTSMIETNLELIKSNKESHIYFQGRISKNFLRGIVFEVF